VKAEIMKADILEITEAMMEMVMDMTITVTTATTITVTTTTTIMIGLMGFTRQVEQ